MNFFAIHQHVVRLLDADACALRILQKVIVMRPSLVVMTIRSPASPLESINICTSIARWVPGCLRSSAPHPPRSFYFHKRVSFLFIDALPVRSCPPPRTELGTCRRRPSTRILRLIDRHSLLGSASSSLGPPTNSGRVASSRWGRSTHAGFDQENFMSRQQHKSTRRSRPRRSSCAVVQAVCRIARATCRNIDVGRSLHAWSRRRNACRPRRRRTRGRFLICRNLRAFQTSRVGPAELSARRCCALGLERRTAKAEATPAALRGSLA